MPVAQALQHVHDHGIVHRDIRPDNIQLTIDAEQPVFIKLLDFGVARIKSHAPVTGEMSTPPRTVAYTAPELLQSTDAFGPAIDIYALGVTLFEILTKQRPFSSSAMLGHADAAPLLSKRRPDLQFPVELESLVAEMLDRQPTSRPTAAAVADQLAEITPKLRSVSARSLQFLRTYVLPKNQGTGPTPRPTSRPPPAKQRSVTQVLAALQSVDEVEADLEQTSEQLKRECKSLIKRLARLWSGGVPANLVELLQRSSDLEVIKNELELDLALHRDELAREKAALRAERNVVRQQLQSLREELRAVSQSSGQSQNQSRAAAQLAQLERAYQAAEPATELAGRVEREEARRQQLSFELRALRRELGETLLRTIWELVKSSERAGSREQEFSLGVYVQRLARLLSRFDALSTALEKF